MKQEVLGRINCILAFDTWTAIKRRVQQFFYCCVCIRWCGNVFISPFPSNDRGIHIQTHRGEGFIKYAVEMGSGAMIYIQSFIKIGSGIQKFNRVGNRDTAW
jgi:hypothetical protein